MFIAGSIYEVESITDNEHLSLFRPFTGVPPANGEYAIIRNTSVTIATRVAAMVAAAINSKQVLLDDLRGYYTSTADKVLIHTDDGSTIEVVPLQTLVSDITNLIAQSESIKNDLANTQAALDLVRQYSNAAQGVEVEPGKYSAKSYAADAADTLALVNKAKSDVDLKASQVQQTKTDIEQFVSTSKTEIDAKATAISTAIATQATTVKGEITTLVTTSKSQISAQVTTGKSDIAELITGGTDSISSLSSTSQSEITALATKSKSDIVALATQSKKDITTLTTTSKGEISDLVAGGTNSITSLTDTSKGAINTLVSASKTEITDLATTEKAAISQQSTAAISEMTSLKQSAEQAASTATQKATQAAASATSAAQSKTDAQTLKTQTEALANETKQVAEEIKSGSYVGWQIYCQSEANMKAARMLASEQFAASGFVDFGRHYSSGNYVPVNEGLWSQLDSPNSLRIGKVTNASGTSKTNHAVTHIAGFISQLININDAFEPRASIKFPEAPNGAVVYDSTGNCRGSGKVNLDLSKEADPKYGDVAANSNEAVARAFEGDCKNGDFRNGTSNWGISGSNVNNSLSLGSSGGYVNGQQTGESAYFDNYTSFEAGSTYRIKGVVNVENIGSGWRLYTRDHAGGGIVFESTTGTGLQAFEVNFTFNSAWTGAKLQLHYQARASFKGTFKYLSVQKVTEEVVTERVDMFGFEFFLEEVSKANPFVYPYGCIQSLASTMEGIATTGSNRPVTYYAAFDGDTGSKGKGVDFWAATDEQKRALVSNPEHNIYLLDDGRLVQWRVRQRTIAGAGNGDWEGFSPVDATQHYLHFYGVFSNCSVVNPQGIKDVLGGNGTSFGKPNNALGYGVFDGNVEPIRPDESLGAYKVRFSHASDGSYAVNGECYFYVCGVVPRLNKGAYHPSFNPMGTRAFAAASGGSSTVTGAYFWYEFGGSSTIGGVTSTLDCFRGYNNGDVHNNIAGSSLETGFIGSTSTKPSGRSDDRLYDAIYASGQGGVIDYRLSAWDMSSKEEAAKIFQKVVNGTYRGKEFATRCDLFVRTSTEPYFYGGKTAIWIEGIDDFIGSRNPRDFKVNGYTVVTAATDGHGQYVYFDSKYGDISSYWKSVSNNVVVTSPTNIPVSGNFNMIDVLGSPERILAKTELANGWLGGWIPVVPNNTLVANKFPMTHVAVDKDLRMYWSDGDAAWQTGTYTFASSLNARDNSSAIPSTRVALHSYTASAKLTKSANIKPILNGANGVGDVYATMFNDRTRGGLLRESFINKVVSGYSQKHPHSQTVKLNKCTLLDGYFASNPDFSPTHECIALGEPAYDDSAIKVLWSQSSNNQQANLNLSFNELIWVGSYSSLNVTKITSTNTATDGVAGQFYLTDPSITNALGNKLLRCVKSFTASWGDVWLENGKGFVYITAPTGDPFLVVYGSQSDLWGDDGKLRIVSEVGTYKNLNGDLCLYGTHELAIPYGYTKNKARAGSQVSGVDL
ncbi:hypothetical protein BWI06_RS09610 [Vibrio parahaemolyticus]|uniref:hypothetical protein n=1 Tax=Vibrio parahaemolyticus TaxID=670 RepID=UPI00111DE83B|nr:hypothetical protein [Vibrio parahaemolyticus]EJE4557727.1 hypothetical protein [Vibrio parahaemolyticus]EJG1765577.1 hypothetical protein [Vibrio parahaemolyticus]ELB2155635.1 hypothetical protein [Vibrio parahaemolyticus]WJK26435.1 hypothetical protein QSJ11_09190 [Vibrio parahaemolyticus]